jgi:branched-chain amino acid transport system ATP-binding protein
MRPLALLEVDNVSKRFGGIVALDEVSFEAEPGEIVGLIGPNGAGKTTAFNVITRLYTPDSGDVRFEGETLLRTHPSGVVRRGIARTFQNVELFRGLTVVDNVRLGAHARTGDQSADDLLFYLTLYSVRYRQASELPYGTQKRVELARALASGPRLLLLDEPAGGLSHEEVGQLGRFIRHGARPRLRPEDRGGHPGRGAFEQAGDRGVSRDVVMSLLELRNVDARYGPVQALHGVTLSVDEGEFVAVLGANGAGKTTTLRAVSGLVKRRGEITFEGRALSSSPEATARAGIAHVPEGRGTFSDLSVWENLRLGAYARRGDVKGAAQRVFEYFPRLQDRRDQQAGTLSGGEQQMLALGRAMMARPKLLLLDEPSLGLAPLVVQAIFEVLEKMKADNGLSVLVVEQNAGLALEHAARAYVLEVGHVVLTGTSDELRKDESVRRSYLGY